MFKRLLEKFTSLLNEKYKKFKSSWNVEKEEEIWWNEGPLEIIFCNFKFSFVSRAFKFSKFVQKLK
jgi:hypothetical protein